MPDRAVRFALDLVDGQEKLEVNAGCKRVGGQLGNVPDSLRNWVQQARVDTGGAPGLTTDEQTRLRELEREDRELRRAKAFSERSGRDDRCEHLLRGDDPSALARAVRDEQRKPEIPTVLRGRPGRVRPPQALQAAAARGAPGAALPGGTG